jgi:ATP-dependent RNA/DNA helicase IGHMBP2
MSTASSSRPVDGGSSSVSDTARWKQADSCSTCPLKDPGAVVPVETWVSETKRLLEVERQAEIDERTSFLEDTNTIDLEASGLCLLSLKVVEQSTGLYGRTLVTVADWSSRLLPSHRIGVGDIVGLRSASGKLSGGKHDITGIVSRVTEYQITLTIDDNKTGVASVEDAMDALPDRVRIDLLANDVTYQRLSSVLHCLESGKFGRADRLVRM